MSPAETEKDVAPSEPPGRSSELATGRATLVAALILVVHAALLTQVLHRGMGMFYDVEEGFPAFVARELNQPGGPSAPWTTYLYEHYQAGTMIAGWLTAPAFALFGETLLALKLPTLLVSLATVALVIALGARLYGRRTGLAAGAVLALGPAPWLIRGVQTLGDTTEVLPLVLVLALLVAALLEYRRPPLVLGAAAGLAAGLALSFSLAALPALGVAALVALPSLVRGPRHRRRALVAGLVTFPCGLALPIHNAVNHEVEFLSWRGHGLAELVGSPEIYLHRFAGIFSEQAALGWQMGVEPEPLSHGAVLWLVRLYWAITLTAWLLALVGGLAFGLRGDERDRRESRADLGLAVLHGAYLASYVVNPHGVYYLLLLTVPTGALLAARLAQRISRGASPLLGAGLLAALALAQLLPLAPLLRFPEDRPLYGMKVVDPPRWRFRVIGYGVRFQQDWLPRLEARPHTLRQIPRDELFGCGHLLAQARGLAALEHIAGADQSRGRLLAEGFGYAHGYDAALPLDDPVGQLAALWPLWLRDAALAGYGRALAERRWLELEQAVRHLPPHLPPGAHRAVLRGMGYGFGMRFWHQPRRFRQIRHWYPGPAWPAFEEGLVMRLRELVPQARRQRQLLAILAEPAGSIAPIVIPARHRVATNCNTDPTTFGPDILIDGGQSPGWARYAVHIDHPGRYRIKVQYATDDPRPLGLLVDGRPAIRPQALPTTGGYHVEQLRWGTLGTVRLGRGSRLLELRAPGLFPHLAALQLERLD